MKNTAALWSQIAPLKLKPETGSCTYIQLAYTTRDYSGFELFLKQRLIVFRKFVLFTISLKNLNENSTSQYDSVKKSVNYFDKLIKKGTFCINANFALELFHKIFKKDQ